MVNIAKILKMAESLKGTKGSFTLGKSALRQVSSKAGKQGEAIFDFATKGLSKPAVDIAYKSSEKGLTIAKATIKDGNKVIGNGAISVSGLGTEQSVIKYRLNMGENGKVLQQNGWIDNSKNLTLDDIATTLTRKNGITTQTSQIGEATYSRTMFDENEFALVADKMVGMPVASQGLALGKNQVQGIVDKIQQGVRDLLAGKEVPLPKDALNKIKSTVGNLKAHKMPKWTKAEKVSQEHMDKLMKQGLLDIKTGTLKAMDTCKKGCIKVPSGKEVPVDEYKNVVKRMIDSSTKVSDKHTESILKEVKQLVEYGEKQGVNFENRSILEEMFKLYRI